MTESKVMALHQLTMKYSPEEDRILFRISTVSREEFRFLITRRYVKQVWPALIQVLEQNFQRQEPHKAHAARELVAFEHEKAVSQINFKGEYEESAVSFPLGEQHILLNGIQIKPAGNFIAMRFLLAAGSAGVEFQLTREILHVFCELIQQAVAAADWNLGRPVLQTAAPQTPRVLH